VATFLVTVRSSAGPVTLKLSQEGSQIVLRWPSESGTVVVEQADHLSAEWQPLRLSPLAEGPDSVVRINVDLGHRFYRLTRP
jgi:hypothetical protein